MNIPTHAHTFREQDISRVMAAYGKKPAQETKAKLHSQLLSQKNKFIELSRLREKSKTRTKGRTGQR
jgi:hypothetical protein